LPVIAVTHMPPMPAPVVLLVQADADSREMYTEFLRYEGLLPVPVSNARDGLTVARKADVIVTGLLLPGDIDGIEFIARLKRDERTKRIPLIVLTACAWKSDRERAEEAGCDVFLAKPCLPDHLLREVRLLLAASKLRDNGRVSTTADRSRDVLNHRERAADPKTG
jgi:two-component system, cell cycle response regulator DivK